MAKRILNCFASDFAAMDSRELLASMAAGEGRTLMAETIGAYPPILEDVTNAELAAAMGADFLLLNLFDVEKPQVQGLLPPPGQSGSASMRPLYRFSAISMSRPSR